MAKEREIQSLVVMFRRLDKLHGGASLRNWQNVQGLAKLGPVDVITVGPDDPARPVSGVRHYEHLPRTLAKGRQGLMRSLWSKRWIASPTAHPMLNSHYNPAVVQWIEGRCRQFSYDVAVVEELGMARYLKQLRNFAKVTVFDAHNIESALSSEMEASRENSAKSGWIEGCRRALLDRRLCEAEKSCASGVDRVWVCSTVDQEGFADMLGGTQSIDVIPNSIDINTYHVADRCHESGSWLEHPLTLTYLGSYSYYPNEQAALELIEKVLPILVSRGIPARLKLVGAQPTQSMRLAAGDNENIEITGAVESIVPYLKEPCVMVFPIRLGSGTRLKVLEAFAASRPVVSTAKGAEGIDGVDGVHLRLRESPEEIAEAAIELWKDSAFRSEICGNALDLVTERYSLLSAERLIRRSLSANIGIGAIPLTADAAALQE